tara:strand:- start:82 stop:861 length:780 start_codon:yes stop_codon:yes gene_type:complete
MGLVPNRPTYYLVQKKIRNRLKSLDANISTLPDRTKIDSKLKDEINKLKRDVENTKIQSGALEYNKLQTSCSDLETRFRNLKQKIEGQCGNQKQIVLSNFKGRTKFCKLKEEESGLLVKLENFSIPKNDPCCMIFKRFNKDDQKTTSDHIWFAGDLETLQIFPNSKTKNISISETFKQDDDIMSYINTTSTHKYSILFSKNKFTVFHNDTPEQKFEVEVYISPNANVKTLFLSKTDGRKNPLQSWRRILYLDSRLFKNK